MSEEPWVIFRVAWVFFALRSANILPRVFLKEQIRESPNPEYKRRPASWNASLESKNFYWLRSSFPNELLAKRVSGNHDARLLEIGQIGANDRGRRVAGLSKFLDAHMSAIGEGYLNLVLNRIRIVELLLIRLYRENQVFMREGIEGFERQIVEFVDGHGRSPNG